MCDLNLFTGQYIKIFVKYKNETSFHEMQKNGQDEPMSYITKDTHIAEIVYGYPELVETLHEHGLYCFS